MPPTKRSGPSTRATKDKPKLSLVEASAPEVESKEAAAERKRQATLERLAAGRAKRMAVSKESRARRNAGEKTPLQRYRDGEYPVDQWDDEEIERGRPKDLGGGFAGPGPKFTAKQHADIRRELLKRGERRLDTYFFDALKVLHSVAMHGEQDTARVKAANLIIERVGGKTVDRVEIKSSDPWGDILQEIMDEDVLEPRQVERDA